MLPKLKFFAVTAALIIALSFSFERSAFAYVDPGSGLLAYQSISTVIVGTLFYFRTRLKALFHKSDRETPQPIESPR